MALTHSIEGKNGIKITLGLFSHLYNTNPEIRDLAGQINSIFDLAMAPTP